MDPTVIVAIINTAGKMANKIIEGLGRPGDQPAQEKKVEDKAEEVVKEQYRQLVQGLTSNCVRVLKCLESGDPRRAKWIWKKAFPKREYQSEFTYRLRYLSAIGLVIESMSEFRITRLGRAFLGEARNKIDFREVLFSSNIGA
jgi:predicted transcriptional regulator